MIFSPWLILAASFDIETIYVSDAIGAEGFFKGFIAQSRRNVPQAFKEMVGPDILLIIVCWAIKNIAKFVSACAEQSV